MKKVLPKFLYLLAGAVCLCLIFVMGARVLHHNTQGAQCDIHLWQEGKIIGKVGFQNWFNWYWDGQPCRFTSDAIFGVYLYAIPLYWFLRELGRKLWPLTQKGGFMLVEFWVWLIVYYGVLILQVHNNQVSITLNILFNLGIGGFIMSLPLLVFILMIIAAKDENDNQQDGKTNE